ncbi:MAG: TetR/AcrR family transcriptional regulator [Candidatus Cloacimonadales bacterium]|jgi:AcrR family transcriptional regulator|nr:TetR/AcrR family transcriptional regulator [Candidatus Cloacimonadota bacterium]MDD2650938.1 TetR/AcrR family transcriptional regulator [Candidatus Cloacimonadota bacterium]MDD3501420.1 TetR/AcrR family transcriptional regulator [Candidatus Cloacimonadota bacterium]MDX9977772.1 TetR/AcrR family transcriptional regulator [Candidatus Cloacimonadales bacterium]
MDNKEDKRELILNTADRLFEKYGYSKTSMDDIASEAFIGKGTIYYYYKTKEDIFLELAKYYHKKIFNRLYQELEKCNSFDDQFKLMINLPLSYAIKSYPVYYEAIQTHSKSLLTKISDFKKEKTALYFNLLKDLFIEAQAKGEIVKTLDVERLISFLLRRILIGDDNIHFKYSKDSLKNMLKDHELIIDIILYGIKKRSYNE